MSTLFFVMSAGTSSNSEFLLIFLSSLEGGSVFLFYLSYAMNV